MITELKGVEISMFLQDFIAERNIKQSAVSMYLKRHAEEFNGHTEQRDGKTWLDDEAVNLLSKKYPVLPADEVWTPTAWKKYSDLQEELQDSSKEIRQLNAENRELRKIEVKYRALETEQRILIAEAVSEKDKEIGILEGFLKDAKENIEYLQEEKESALKDKQNEIDQLKAELQAEKSRKWKFPWSK